MRPPSDPRARAHRVGATGGYSKSVRYMHRITSIASVRNQSTRCGLLGRCIGHFLEWLKYHGLITDQLAVRFTLAIKVSPVSFRSL